MRQWGQAVVPACPQMALGEIVTMRNISLLIKPVSGICNMMCEYCFYCDEAKKENTACIWDDEWKKHLKPL